MNPVRNRILGLAGIVALAVAVCLAFPRVLAFVEKGAVELRYFWWLILLLAVAAWLLFFAGRKRQ